MAMSVATLTSKGQITIPKDVRESMGLKPGSKLLWVKISDRQYRVVARTGSIEDLAGILYRPGQRALTIEEINEGIAEGAAHGAMRGVSYQDE